jgi:protein-disulfide isomerase
MSQQDMVWRVLDRSLGVATLACVVVVGWIASHGQSDRTPPRQMAPPRPASVMQVSNLKTSEGALVRRQGHPMVALIEFSDFQCPFCGKFARDTYVDIQREFVDTGKVEYIFRQFPLSNIHPLALDAARAAACASQQDMFWPMHDRLFANQTALSASALSDDAKAIGVNQKRFTTCLAGNAPATVNSDHAEGERVGIKSTPTFLIGTLQADRSVNVVTKVIGAQPYAVFKRELEKALNAMTPSS